MSLSDILLKYNIERSSADELYTRLFHIGEGYIQKQGEYRDQGSTDFKGNPIIYVNDRADYKGDMRRYIGLEDTLISQLHQAQNEPSNLLNAISYYGRKKDKEYGDRCFGLIFDIDDIDDVTLNRFLHGCFSEYHIYPLPNFLVVSRSGHGMHLYYIFDEPVRLFPKTKIQLKTLKYTMTKWLWNPYTSNNENVQYQSYDQSFMIAGTEQNMTVWKIRDELYPVKELFNLAGVAFDENDIWLENQYTLAEAKEKFPKWYEKVIVNGDTEKGHWTCKRDLYDWWIGKILDSANGATYGHRYWCVMMLVIYAVKCGLAFEEVKKQAYELIPVLNDIKPDAPFTKADVKSALECFDVQFATFPIDDISRLSGIPIEKNKRNYRKQADHLERARAVQNIDYPNGEWRNSEGRPDKAEIVEEWRKLHPDGKRAECIRDTGVDKKTVYKWWDGKEASINKAAAAQENKKFRVDMGDGTVAWMTKREIAELNQAMGSWHKQLPEYFVIDGAPDMLSKMMKYAEAGVRSVEILSQEEYDYLVSKEKK